MPPCNGFVTLDRLEYLQTQGVEARPSGHLSRSQLLVSPIRSGIGFVSFDWKERHRWQ